MVRSSLRQKIKQEYHFKGDSYSSHARILQIAAKLRPGRALDVGCAEGHIARELSKLGWQVDGVEYDQAFAKKANRHCKKVFVGDVTNESFVDKLPKRYDLIVLGDVIEHVANPDEVMKRVATHLAPQGRYIFSVPNVAHLYVRLSLLLGVFEYWEKGILDKTHLRFFTRKTLAKFFARNNVKPLAWTVTPTPLPEISKMFAPGSVFSWVHSWSHWLATIFPRLLGYQFVVLATRLK